MKFEFSELNSFSGQCITQTANCSLHFTLSLHFTPGPQSAVCSPQSAFYTDRFDNARCVTVCDRVKDQSIPNHYSSNLYVYISTQPDFKSIIDQLLSFETSKIRINHINVTLTYSVLQSK